MGISSTIFLWRLHGSNFKKWIDAKFKNAFNCECFTTDKGMVKGVKFNLLDSFSHLQMFFKAIFHLYEIRLKKGAQQMYTWRKNDGTLICLCGVLSYSSFSLSRDSSSRALLIAETQRTPLSMININSA